MRSIGFVYEWICDYERQTAYRPLPDGRYVRRDSDGITEVITSLPNHVQQFLEESSSANAA